MLNDVTLDLAEHLHTQMLGTRLRDSWKYDFMGNLL